MRIEVLGHSLDCLSPAYCFTKDSIICSVSVWKRSPLCIVDLI